MKLNFEEPLYVSVNAEEFSKQTRDVLYISLVQTELLIDPAIVENPRLKSTILIKQEIDVPK